MVVHHHQEVLLTQRMLQTGALHPTYITQTMCSSAQSLIIQVMLSNGKLNNITSPVLSLEHNITFLQRSETVILLSKV